MKRGFLNTERYKRSIDGAHASDVAVLPPVESPTPASRAKEKSDVNSEADPDVEMKTVNEDTVGWDKTLFGRSAQTGVLPPRPLPPDRPGWGRRPDEEFFHTVPAEPDGTKSETKRAVFRLWPRNRDGKVLAPNVVPQGKLSPDGYPWAETLYDIFLVNRLPEIDDYVVTVTGSKLCAAVEELGELDVAASEIRWVKSEGQPRIEGAADTEELIRRAESKLPLLPSIISTFENENGGPERDSERDSTTTDDRHASDEIPSSSTILITSPFHPSHYPKPLPLTPFAYGGPMSILLQEGIPLHLLPQTLYVHDPFSLLSAVERRCRDTSWTSRSDVVRTYNLHLSGSVRSQIKEARRKAEELEEFKARTLIILRYERTEEQIKNHEAVIEIPLPPYSRRPTKIEESHLFISPVAKVGKGHHSLVYKGEWELPREVFAKQRICPQCFKESVDKEVQRLKDTGRWAKLMKLAWCGPNGVTQAELDEVNDPPCLERDGEIIERELTCVASPKLLPAKIVDFLDDSDPWDMFMKQEGTHKLRVNFVNMNDSDQHSKNATAPVIRIDVPFTSETSCTHREFQGPVPRTAKFTVVAKLSFEDDCHLTREARNYQQFPEHLFHHYNGYTIIRQLHAIVPVHAVVPQFYGYYTPDENENKEAGSEQPSYLSPILLLEHCGKPIDPDELTHEDQEECASLLLRFQRAGWLHDSVAPRNFLVQLGKPTEFPEVRKLKPETSFRLIDFGRSSRYDTVEEKRSEEVEVLEMFGSGELPSQMGLTLSFAE